MEKGLTVSRWLRSPNIRKNDWALWMTAKRMIINGI
jgi:hypothetical protein